MIKNKSLLIIFFVLAISTILYTFNRVSAKSEAKSVNSDLIERGEYLVELGGCHDCHTPKKMTDHGPLPDNSLSLSGHPQNLSLPKIDPNMIGSGKWILFNEHGSAAVGPWGVSFAANLTPDERTGIGLWKENHFIQAMKTGKHMGAGRPILPPMPWFNLTNAKEEDLKAIFAYLKSLKPIRNAVPAPIPPDRINR